jgi:hypothetical protein
MIRRHCDKWEKALFLDRFCGMASRAGGGHGNFDRIRAFDTARRPVMMLRSIHFRHVSADV